MENLETVYSAAPIIKKYAMGFLKKNKNEEVTLKAIKQYIKDQTGQEFSSGSFSGAMRDLIEESKGRVVNVERGVYSYLEDIKRAQINKVLDETISKLSDLVYDNILELSKNDFEVIKTIPILIEQIENMKIEKKRNW